MDLEMESMYFNSIWELVDLPEGEINIGIDVHLEWGVVVWRSIKQGCIADSTIEAEYVAACEAAKEAVWLRKFLHDLEVVPNMNLPITLYCDNSETVANSKEPFSHRKRKHIKLVDSSQFQVGVCWVL
ncbi:gag/pol protein [Cucumis melo var. makuwa]|uniref:Gag/pol protein n=1 Tax=Cucumis melo var. makuwa TaxID=1194695 RepID=A0A5A7TWJ5_CUCMM|nr:gag/pol protein [Cucumis melo var. makuwa]